MRYRKTFLSYPHEDAWLARQLVRLLTQNGVPVWFDAWELDPALTGSALNDALESAIDAVDAMVVLETEAYRERKAQNVPGAALSHASARLTGPINDAPIIGHEEAAWIIGRAHGRLLFKSVLLRITARPGRPPVIPIAEEARVVRKVMPHDDLPLTPARRAVYRHRQPVPGHRDYVGWNFVEWPGDEPPPPPAIPAGYYDELVGQIVHFRATSVDDAIPKLLGELRR